MTRSSLDIPRAWEQVEPASLRGVLMVLGRPDAGKSTFARYLYRRLAEAGRRAVFVDGDPGQSALGPPTTLTLVTNALPGEVEAPLNDPFRDQGFLAAGGYGAVL